MWRYVQVNYSDLEIRIMQRALSSPPEYMCIICWRDEKDVPAAHFMRARHGEKGWMGHCEAHALRDQWGRPASRYDTARAEQNLVRLVMER